MTDGINHRALNGRTDHTNGGVTSESTTHGLDLEDKESRYIPTNVDSGRFAPALNSVATYNPSPSYTRIDFLQCHWKRRREITAAHPELANLKHHDPTTGFWVLVCVVVMTVSAYILRDASWLTLIAAAYLFGAFVDHALWVLIHDLTHNLAFESAVLNVVFLCIANMPHVVPSGVSFRYYHRLHHSHLNETYADPDIPGPYEAAFFSRSPLRKALWLLFFPLMQILRTLRFSQNILNHWLVLNWALSIGFGAAAYHLMGLRALVYLLISSLTSIGLHPVGTRWIAEHYAVTPGQETYSYYGPLNATMFNIGYHNEHHDLPDVPWSLLPRVTATAPEFYQPLYKHSSYVGLLWNFITDSRFTLFSRVVRSPAKALTKS